METLKSSYYGDKPIFLDAINDPNETGLVGPKFSHISTGEGDLDSKIGLKDRQKIDLDSKIGPKGRQKVDPHSKIGLKDRQKVDLDGKIGLKGRQKGRKAEM